MNDAGNKSLFRRLAALLVVSLGAGIVIGSGAGGSAGSSGSASATAVRVVVPGLADVVGGAVSSAEPAQSRGGFRYPEDGSLLSIASFDASAAATQGGLGSQAAVNIFEVSIFGGEITVGGVASRAQARVEADGVTTDSVGSTITALTVLGEQHAPTPGGQIAVADWGVVDVGATENDGEPNRRQIVFRSLRLTLIADHAGYPAGTELTIGTTVAELQASEQPTQPATTAAAPTAKPKPQPPGARTKPNRAADQKRKRRGPANSDGIPFGPLDLDVERQLTKDGYVFPIFGQANFSSTFGAARANTGWHHGTDIFAPFGAPVLAIANGTLFSVGWNKVGGYRLWLRDRAGNQFYYAHLAAYSPLARNGREVRAGQVIGYNGNTGDAQGTPFHVHFEFHPVSLLPMGYDGVVDPYPLLIAWRRVEDVALLAGTGWAPPVPATATAPQPGAFLLESTDISSASGLEPGALERVMVPSRGTDNGCTECERIP